MQHCSSGEGRHVKNAQSYVFCYSIYLISLVFIGTSCALLPPPSPRLVVAVYTFLLGSLNAINSVDPLPNVCRHLRYSFSRRSPPQQQQKPHKYVLHSSPPWIRHKRVSPSDHVTLISAKQRTWRAIPTSVGQHGVQYADSEAPQAQAQPYDVIPLPTALSLSPSLRPAPEPCSVRPDSVGALLSRYRLIRGVAHARTSNTFAPREERGIIAYSTYFAQ